MAHRYDHIFICYVYQLVSNHSIPFSTNSNTKIKFWVISQSTLITLSFFVFVRITVTLCVCIYIYIY
ncbi:hypothetical protein Hanom_Chr10g00890501 [Helianthus anomalus]